MIRKRVLGISSLVVAWVILLSAIGICGTTLQVNKTRQPAVQTTAPAPSPAPAQTPTIKKQQAPRQVIPLYSMAIENLGLTNQCQVKFTVRNTGANLSVDQHKKSYLKVGQNPPISLKTFDPAGRLRTKGKTMISLQNEPITKNTNIKVLVMLFNGKKISKQKLLKPTCGPKITPRKVTQPTKQAPTVTPRKAIKPTSQTPTVQKDQVPQQVVQIYSMAIENLSLTNQCQVKFTVRNTGANLSVDQHKNSYLKMGQNQPISLKTFDPAGRLRTKGKTMISLQNEPITKDTNYTVGLTLFNNKQITEQKLLKPTCASKMTIQKVPQAVTAAPTGPSPPPPMTTKSGDSPMGSKLIAVPKQHISMPKTILQVERMGGDLQTWDSWAGTDTSMQKMDFRFKTELESLILARWEVSLTPDFPYVIAKGQVTPIPPKGMYGRFSINLSSFSGTYTKPATFFIRVRPIKFGGMKVMASGGNVPSTSPSTPAEEQHEPSTTVRVTLVEAGSGPVTEFHLPERHLKVVFTKALIVDDSDDLSGGDLRFKFTVNGESKWKTFSDDKYDTGDMANLGNKTLIITDPPNFTGVSIMGCDDDDTPGEFSSGKCGNDPDKASVSFDIPTGKKLGRWKIPYTTFSHYAQGSSLKFEVHGYYEMYCDPCP